jgi:chromosomal replication initiation ATPase DnaA
MRTHGQLPLPFETAPSYAREDFLIGKANEAAFSHVERWPRWLAPAAVLIGPEGSGKTHLAAIFGQASLAPTLRADHLTEADVPELARQPALVIEDADRFPPSERALFHLMNLAREKGVFLLITARLSPDTWGIATPDLLSRLRAQPLLTLTEPDEALLAALMVKLFADRQLVVQPEAIRFALLRIERSYRAVQRFVARVDQETMRRKSRATRDVIAEVLHEIAASAQD